MLVGVQALAAPRPPSYISHNHGAALLRHVYVHAFGFGVEPSSDVGAHAFYRAFREIQCEPLNVAECFKLLHNGRVNTRHESCHPAFAVVLITRRHTSELESWMRPHLCCKPYEGIAKL